MNQLELVILQALEGLRTPSEYRRDQSNGNKYKAMVIFGKDKKGKNPIKQSKKRL